MFWHKLEEMDKYELLPGNIQCNIEENIRHKPFYRFLSHERAARICMYATSAILFVLAGDLELNETFPQAQDKVETFVPRFLTDNEGLETGAVFLILEAELTYLGLGNLRERYRQKQADLYIRNLSSGKMEALK